MNRAATYRTYKLRRYYRYHSAIYDWTRWSFLFGRKRLVESLPALPRQPHIREVGCGTGVNLARLLRKYPEAHIRGVDLSTAMLRKAEAHSARSDRIQLANRIYGNGDAAQPNNTDLVLLSYTLTMEGVPPEKILREAREELKPGGYIAVVDFHSTSFGWFRRWMKQNHVRIDGRLPALLRNSFHTVQYDHHQAYLGLWRYFMYIGQKR